LHKIIDRGGEKIGGKERKRFSKTNYKNVSFVSKLLWLVSFYSNMKKRGGFIIKPYKRK
jgi:hypothetical protein